jgi:hypothetical protein
MNKTNYKYIHIQKTVSKDFPPPILLPHLSFCCAMNPGGGGGGPSTVGAAALAAHVAGRPSLQTHATRDPGTVEGHRQVRR